MTREEHLNQLFEGSDDAPHDHEADMARSQLYRTAQKAVALFKMIQSGDNLEGWTAAKITKAADYLDSVHNYMTYEMVKQQEMQRMKAVVSAEDSYFDDLENKLGEAKQKGVDGKACWDGYKRMGTKKKGGKTVDNCVPMSAAEKNKK